MPAMQWSLLDWFGFGKTPGSVESDSCSTHSDSICFTQDEDEAEMELMLRLTSTAYVLMVVVQGAATLYVATAPSSIGRDQSSFWRPDVVGSI